jgi:hypothetical protein
VNVTDNVLGTARGDFRDRRIQARAAEQFPIAVLGLDQSVAVTDQYVPGSEEDLGASLNNAAMLLSGSGSLSGASPHTGVCELVSVVSSDPES